MICKDFPIRSTHLVTLNLSDNLRSEYSRGSWQKQGSMQPKRSEKPNSYCFGEAGETITFCGPTRNPSLEFNKKKKGFLWAVQLLVKDEMSNISI